MNKIIKHNWQCFIIMLFLFIALLSNNSPAQEISSNEYQLRRLKLLGLMDDSSAVVLKTADAKLRNGDVTYRYRQESNCFYLTGLNETNSYLMLVPKGVEVGREKIKILFFKPDVKNDSLLNDGSSVLNSSKFILTLKSILPGLNKIYTASGDVQFVHDWLNDRMLFVERDNKKYFEAKNHGVKIKNISTIINQLREIKSEAEIASIQKAINITKDGIVSAIKICKPGCWEYQLRAAIEGEMLMQGSDYPGFPSIIGSGENSLVLHYDKDNRQMQNGDVVVMDVGAEYGGYSADITRTIPVSGKFTEAQKKIYSLVLDAQKQAIDIIKPGISIYDLDKKVLEVFAKAGMDSFLPHGVSHPLGLDVHDVASNDTLKAGMVITIEPGLYFPTVAKNVGAEFRGFGMRIEDDILITTDGHKILTGNVPKEIADVEALFLNDKE